MAGSNPTGPVSLPDPRLKGADFLQNYNNPTTGVFRENLLEELDNVNFRGLIIDMALSLTTWRELNIKRVKGATYPVNFTDQLSTIPLEMRVVSMQAKARYGIDSGAAATMPAGTQFPPPIYFELLPDSAGVILALPDEDATVNSVKCKWVRVNGSLEEILNSFDQLVLEDQPYKAGDVRWYEFPNHQKALVQWKADSVGFTHPAPTGLDSDPIYRLFAPLLPADTLDTQAVIAAVRTWLQSLPGYVNDNTVSLRGNFTWATSGTTAPVSTPPGQVLNLTATAGDGQVVLNWTAPTTPGSSPITRYIVSNRLTGATSYTGLIAVLSSSRTATITGLVNGQAYDFIIQARSAEGDGLPSAPASVTPATAPGKVLNLTATAGNGQVVLNWDAPTTNGGSPLTRYLISDRLTGASSFQTLFAIYATYLTATVTGLTNGQAYDFMVQARSAIGDGLPSAPASATPAAPVTVPAHVQSFNATLGGALSTGAQLALSNLYTGLVAEGLWSKLHALYLFLPGATESSYNFRDASAFRLTYGGGVTSSAAGLTSDGTGYYNTGFVPADSAAGVDNLGFDLCEDFTTSAGLANSLGVSDYSGAHQIGIYRAGVSENHADTTCYMSSSDSDPAQQVTFLLNAQTMLSLQRSSGDKLQLYQYGRRVAEIVAPPQGLSGQGFAVWGFCKNNFNTAPDQYHPGATGTHKHLAIRQSLTDAQVETLTQLLHAYHVETGRIPKADVFFGDSISHELNVVDSWPKRYTSKAGTMMQNFAVSGQIGQTVINDGTFAAQLPTYNPAIHRRLHLAWGTNDANNGESASDFAGLLGTAFDVATARNWPAGSIVAMPAFYQKADANGASRLAYLAACGSVVSNKGGKLINIYQKMKDRPNADAELFGDDTLHPLDPVGPEFIATAVFAEIG